MRSCVLRMPGGPDVRYACMTPDPITLSSLTSIIYHWFIFHLSKRSAVSPWLFYIQRNAWFKMSRLFIGLVGFQKTQHWGSCSLDLVDSRGIRMTMLFARSSGSSERLKRLWVFTLWFRIWKLVKDPGPNKEPIKPTRSLATHWFPGGWVLRKIEDLDSAHGSL
jgi:hypothetical protein